MIARRKTRRLFLLENLEPRAATSAFYLGISPMPAMRAMATSFVANFTDVSAINSNGVVSSSATDGQVDAWGRANLIQGFSITTLATSSITLDAAATTFAGGVGAYRIGVHGAMSAMVSVTNNQAFNASMNVTANGSTATAGNGSAPNTPVNLPFILDSTGAGDFVFSFASTYQGGHNTNRFGEGASLDLQLDINNAVGYRAILNVNTQEFGWVNGLRVIDLATGTDIHVDPGFGVRDGTADTATVAFSIQANTLPLGQLPANILYRADGLVTSSAAPFWLYGPGESVTRGATFTYDAQITATVFP